MAYVRRRAHRRCRGQVPLRALERYGIIAVHNMLLMLLLMLVIISVMCRFMRRRRRLGSDPSQTALEHDDGQLLCFALSTRILCKLAELSELCR